METLQLLIQRVERLERIINTMQPKKDEWVGASVITKRTGWDNEGLRKARRNGSVKFKVKKEGGKRTYAYLLSSIQTQRGIEIDKKLLNMQHIDSSIKNLE